ncbi:MAG: flagellar filament capping protein FliD, partial [Planctomycetales bacterium]|nr:flagellar filament capping protein FliD [Planctomycetales bacterium]
MATIDGLATGLDTTTIIDGLVRIQQLQVDQLTARKNSILEEQTAFKGIESKMIDLRAQLGSLARSQNSVFSARSAVSSDEDALTVTAATGAAAGVYNLTMNSLAQAEQVASQGFASADSEISQGTFSLRVGRGKEVEITIDSSNNTLQGLADAINAAGGDVGASIVNDGSTGGTPYKLLLSSSKTGAANTITITNNLAAGATQPDFTGTPVQAAADASVTLGSGAGALTVTHDTNQLDDLIGGVTLDLHQADAAKSISVTIARDTDTAVATVQRFVEAFNGLMGFIDDQVRF